MSIYAIEGKPVEGMTYPLSHPQTDSVGDRGLIAVAAGGAPLTIVPRVVKHARHSDGFMSLTDAGFDTVFDACMLRGKHGTVWFGDEYFVDEHGREWDRRYRAVMDDFGGLVEVPRV